ncbi:MAG: ABC transporter ATP-binding protein [Gammaproteobacteria bacterium]|nr:MAG: ABC transporter ATP-binding protein [Gammaproteobacteria bacterium]
MIHATNLTKRYKRNTVVNSVSLDIKKGEIFGLLGPNAAGKTTVIRMLCGLVTNDEGKVRIDDMNIAEARINFGYVAQYFGQYEELSVWENLRFYAHLYGVDDDHRLHALLQRYALQPFKNQMAGTLSGGYQRRLALACALAHDPKVLFLDEPTTGIDPVTRKLLWDDFYKLSTEGKTLFVTTHYMEEAQRCHQLAFMAEGRIIARGTPDSIKDALGEVVVYTMQSPYLPRLHTALLALDGMLLINQFGAELRVVVKPELNISFLQDTITHITGKPVTLKKSIPNLEDVFIALTQGGAEA